jgi:hypothetical protein
LVELNVPQRRATTKRVASLSPLCRRVATACPDHGLLMSTTTNQEAVMGQPFPSQHPAVVLRSNFNLVRALLIVAMAGILALAAAVVILANDGDEAASSAGSAATAALPSTAVHSHPLNRPDTRFDGGPEEGTRGIAATQAPAASRYDGGPDEGTRGGITTRAPNSGSDVVVIPQGPGGPR